MILINIKQRSYVRVYILHGKFCSPSAHISSQDTTIFPERRKKICISIITPTHTFSDLVLPLTLNLSLSASLTPLSFVIFSLLHTGTYYSIFTFFLKLLTLKTIRKASALFNSKTIKLISPNNTQMICLCPIIYFPAMFFVLILIRSRNKKRILTSKQYRIVNI